MLWESPKPHADEVESGLKDEIDPEIAFLAAHWPKDCHPASSMPISFRTMSSSWVMSFPA